MTPSLYDRLGGEDAVTAAVGLLYDRILADETLRPWFDHLDMGKQVDKQIAFLTMVFGGPNTYTGRDLRVAHAKLVRDGLNDDHFDALVVHLRETLEELAVEPEIIEEVLQLVSDSRGEVLGPRSKS